MIRRDTRVDESKTDINEGPSETQVGSQGPLLIVSFSCCPQQTWQMSFLSVDFPVIIDDRSVGSIRLFRVIDYQISANCQHNLLVLIQLIMFLAEEHLSTGVLPL